MTEGINPITRTEVYLAKLCGAEVTIPEPVTRTDLYYAKLCGMDIDIPSPVTRGEMYLAKLCGMEVDIPSPITRMEMYMAAACGLDIDIQTPEPITRIEQYWAIYLSTVAFTQEYTGALPIAITAHRQALLDYRIYGNSVQDGTPTPEEPVEVVSVGDRTANLLDLYSYKTTKNVTLQITSNKIIGSFDSVRDSYIIYQLPVTPNQIYTISGEYTSTTYHATSVVVSVTDSTSGEWFNNNNGARLFRREVTGNHFELSFQSENNFVSVFIVFTSHENNQTGTTIFKNLQIQEGAKATEFEPYGKYKIPVTVSGKNGEETTTNIYLDEPLRKIGDYADYVDFEKQQLIKNVAVVNFTGEEEWRVQGNAYFTYIAHTPSETPPTLCSAFSLSTSGSAAVGEYRLAGIDSWNGNVLFNYDDGADGVDNFKSYLAQQYANGTPVKFYYLRVTPITELIELPQIPTFAGTNVIDVDTAVKPSQMYVKGRITPISTTDRKSVV